MIFFPALGDKTSSNIDIQEKYFAKKRTSFMKGLCSITETSLYEYINNFEHTDIRLCRISDKIPLTVCFSVVSLETNTYYFNKHDRTVTFKKKNPHKNFCSKCLFWDNTGTRFYY